MAQEQQSTKQVAIVLLEKEDLFLDLLQRFPARRFPVVFAAEPQDAQKLCETGEPRLLIVPLADKTPQELEPLLNAARAADARILGLGAADGVAAGLAQLVDQLVAVDDSKQVLDVAAALLEDRRSAPRARVSIPVTVSKLGRLTATVISARSLFLPTDTPLQGGQMVQISIESSGGKLTCWATVLRVGKGELAESGMVLGIPERERAVRAHLDGLVRGALLLEHVEHKPGPVPESVSKKLSDRLQRDVSVMRETLQAQMALTDALSDRLDALVASDARTIKWQDVKPLLARKLSTQQQQIKSLLQRVDDLTADHTLAQELRATLQTQGELEEKLQQQQQVIDGLRAQLDEMRARDGRGPGPPPGTVQGLGQIIHQLIARVEQLESVGVAAAPSAEMLAQYGERIAELSRRIERLQDYLRLGAIEPQQASALQGALEQGQRELQSQLEALERGEWVPIPQVPDFELPAFEEPTVPGVVVDPQGGQFEPAEEAGGYDEASITADVISADADDAEGLEEVSAVSLPGIEEVVSLQQPQSASSPDSSARVAAGEKPTVETPIVGGPFAQPAATADPAEVVPTRSRLPLLLGAGGTGLIVIGVGLWLLLWGREPVRGVEHAAIDAAPAVAVAPPVDAVAAVPRVDQALAAAEPDAGEASAAAADSHLGVADAAVAAAEQPAVAKPARGISRAVRRRRARRVHLHRARVLLRNNKYAESRRYLTKALAISDDDVVRSLLATSHEKAKELWPAAHHLKKAIALAPARSRGRLLDQLGLIYARLGKKVLACQKLRAALASEPPFKAAEKHLGRHCP